MTEQEKKDLQEFRLLWDKLSQQSKERAAAAMADGVRKEVRA